MPRKRDEILGHKCCGSWMKARTKPVPRELLDYVEVHRYYSCYECGAVLHRYDFGPLFPTAEKRKYIDALIKGVELEGVKQEPWNIYKVWPPYGNALPDLR